MKKVSLSLLSLVFLGSMAFAQDPALKWGGYLDGGVKSIILSDSGNQGAVASGDDIGNTIRLSGSFSATEWASLNFRIDYNYLTNALTVGNAYANLGIHYLDGLGARVLFGNIDGVSYGGVDDIGFGPSGSGIQFRIKPAGTALDAGVQYHTVATTNAWTAQIGQVSGGFKYAIEGFGTLSAGVNTAVNSDKALALDVLNGAFSLSAVPNLTFFAGFQQSNMAAKGSNALQTIDAKVGYSVDALSVSALVYYYMYGSDTKYGTAAAAADASLKATGSLGYKVSDGVSVGADLTYQMGSAALAPTNKLTTITIKPSVTLNVDPKAKVILYASNATQSGDNAPAKDKGTTTLVADFRYSF